MNFSTMPGPGQAREPPPLDPPVVQRDVVTRYQRIDTHQGGWSIHRNRSGAPRWYQRWREAWWVLTGQWSLHRAWQNGMDYGTAQEYRRTVTVRGR